MTAAGTTGFQFIGGRLALDLVNTVANRLGEARDYLSDDAALDRWSRLAGLPQAPRSLRDARTLREELHAVFHPLALGTPVTDEAMAPLNRRLGPALAGRLLRVRDGDVVWSSRTTDAIEIILLDAAELLTSGAWRKLRQCEDEACGWLFLDASRSGARRWCRMADCGNRAKARRHYRRISSSKG